MQDDFRAIIEEQNQQIKVLRDQIAELKMELEGHNRTFSVSSQHVPRLT
jgi:hypothetical protein